MATVRVKKTPRKSWDPDRPPSSLILDQIQQLEWAVLPASVRKPASRRRKVKTEAQAAARIAQLTQILREAADPAQVAPAAMKLPPLPPAPKRAQTKSPKAVSRRPAAAKKAGATAKKVAPKMAKNAVPRKKAGTRSAPAAKTRRSRGRPAGA